MTAVSMSEFETAPGRVRAAIRKNGPVTLTYRGKPSMVVIDVENWTAEELRKNIARLEMKQHLRDLRAYSAKTGGDKLTMDEINAEIAAYRQGN
jgi:prevent-host-death family protein